MLKYLLVLDRHERPLTFNPTRTMEFPEIDARVFLEGEDFVVENYFEGYFENGVLQFLHPVDGPRTFAAKSLEEWLGLLDGFDGFVSGFSCAGELTVFRDFIGLIPVFAGGRPVAATNVAAEALRRNLAPLKPGTILSLSTEKKKTLHLRPTEKTDVHMFVEVLSDAVSKFCPRNTAVFFSGGIDSLIIAKIMSDRGLRPLLLTAGVAGSKDFAAAEKAVLFLGLDHEKIFVDEGAVRAALAMLEKVLGGMNVMDSAIGAALAILSRRAAELGRYAAVLGQGADEIFGGYSKYEKTYVELGYDGLADDLERDLNFLGYSGLVRDFTAIRMGGAYPIPLYLTKNVLEHGLGVPVSLKVASVEGKIVRKHFLRMVCRELGLGEFADTAKKALQYGSGIEKMVRKLR
ncbi:MAG: asparagine synthase-related protein [Candidatus Caldarchaeum sp.]|nr:asparagine synthase-related protein [Candidatus Caldarchaeum sp.]